MQNRQIIVSGTLDEYEHHISGAATLYFNESRSGNIKFKNVPNSGKVEVIIPFYQKMHGKYVVTHGGVVLSGYLQDYKREENGRVVVWLVGARVGDTCFKDIKGFVEVIVPLNQKIKAPKDTIWCNFTGEHTHLVNKHEVLSVVSISGRWTLRVGPSQQWHKEEGYKAGMKAVIESLAVQGLGGYKYE